MVLLRQDLNRSSLKDPVSEPSSESKWEKVCCNQSWEVSGYLGFLRFPLFTITLVPGGGLRACYSPVPRREHVRSWSPVYSIYFLKNLRFSIHNHTAQVLLKIRQLRIWTIRRRLWGGGGGILTGGGERHHGGADGGNPGGGSGGVFLLCFPEHPNIIIVYVEGNRSSSSRRGGNRRGKLYSCFSKSEIEILI